MLFIYILFIFLIIDISFSNIYH